MMQLENRRRGEQLHPLDEAVLLGASDGEVTVRDGCGREYFRAPGAERIAFTIGGALGCHVVTQRTAEGEKTFTFPVGAVTEVKDAAGRYHALLTRMQYTMMSGYGGPGCTLWNGQIYTFFISWLRDHVHVLKGMKYYSADLKSGIDVYRESQREDGMIWDNIQRRGPEPNYWDTRFGEGGFIRPFEDYTSEFKRIPVEADVEYLYVEGLYYTRKATGDDAWMEDSLNSAVRALEYVLTDPYRWSEKYRLVKRGHTIDTWDFQDSDNSTVANDPMRVHPEKTNFGIMFGDNTGYAIAFRQMAEMLDYVGRQLEAERYRTLEKEFRERLNRLSWNGEFFTHHVPENPEKAPDLGVDESTQISLSNAYSLNRNIGHEQAKAIIATYQRIKNELPQGSPGEWYTIYPPFERGYGDHNSKWQYMNASVTPIVAGELAHGAFEHGAEAYGVDILNRMLDLAQEHGGILHSSYTGHIPTPPERMFHPLDLSTVANADFAGTGEVPEGVKRWTEEGDNDLHEMPVGKQNFKGIDFEIADPARNGGRGCAIISTREGYLPRVEVPVKGKAKSLYFLHTSAKAGAGGAVASLYIHYADGSTYRQSIVSRVNVSGWWLPEAPRQHGNKKVDVAWYGANAHCLNVGMLVYGLDNPHPEREISHLELRADEGSAMWIVAGITLSDAPVFLGTNPISYGIPNGWCAAAVVYALIEGLAGVVDEATAFDRVQLAPRWAAAGENHAQATVVYPASGGYLSYDYAHDVAGKTVSLKVAGSGETAEVHLLLPEDASDVVEVRIDERPTEFRQVAVEQSRYVDFALPLVAPRRVEVLYT